MLGKKQATVDGDVEDPAATAYQDRLESETLLDLSRQTGGSGKVVSNNAVFDLDLHLMPSSNGPGENDCDVVETAVFVRECNQRVAGRLEILGLP